MEGNNGESKQPNNDHFEISLRPFDLSDIDDFMVWITDKEVARFCHWKAYATKQEALNYMKEKVIPHPWYRAICLNGKPIGAAYITPFSGDDRCRAELGYVLGSKYWGKGIATRAVRLVARTIFEEWSHLDRLEGLVDVDNMDCPCRVYICSFT